MMAVTGRNLVFALMGALVAASSALGHAQSAAPVVAAPQPSGVPGDPDEPFVEATCAACHPMVQITARHMKAEEWAAIVDRMIGLGAQVTSQEDRDRIIAWLAAHQGPQ